MNILFFSHQADFIYGGEICSLEVMRLLKKKHKVIFAGPAGLYSEAARKIVPTYEVPTIQFSRNWKIVLPLLLAWIKSLIVLKQIIAQEKIEILHCTSLKAMVYARYLPLLSNIKIVWHHYDILPANAQNHRWLRWLSRTADLILTPSLAAKNALIESGIPEQQIQVVYNGFSLQSKIKKVSYTPAEKIKLIMVGEVSERKGVDRLKPILNFLSHEQQLQMQIDIYGSALSNPIYADQVQNDLAPWITQEIVNFKGHREKIGEILPNYDCLILLSRQDPLPTVIIEAFFAGIPVLATNVGGVPEMVISGKNGFICKHEADFAEQIEAFLQDRTPLQKLGQEARHTAVEKFSAQQMVSSLESAYHSLAIPPQQKFS